MRQRARGSDIEDPPAYIPDHPQSKAQINNVTSKQLNEKGGKYENDKSIDVFSKQIGKSSTTANIYTKDGNINFFKDLESGQGTTGSLTNKEHEAEERAEKEKYEKQIGLLTYLGQDTLELNKTKAWYNTETECVSSLWTKSDRAATSVAGSSVPDTDSDKALLQTDVTEDNDPNFEVGLKNKKHLDPLNDIIKYTGWKPNLFPSQTTTTTSTISQENTANRIQNVNDKEERKLSELLKKRKQLDREIESLTRRSRKSHQDKIKNKRKHKHRKTKESPYGYKSSKRNRSGSSSDDAHSYRSSKRRRTDTDENSDNNSKKKRKSILSQETHSSDSDRSRKKSRKCRHSKNTTKSNKRTRSSSTSSSGNSYESDESEKETSLATLRKERLAREAVERLRAQRLLSGQHPDKPEQAPPINAVPQKYNAQFNPSFARQNKTDNVLQRGVKYF